MVFNIKFKNISRSNPIALFFFFFPQFGSSIFPYPYQKATSMLFFVCSLISTKQNFRNPTKPSNGHPCEHPPTRGLAWSCTIRTWEKNAKSKIQHSKSANQFCTSLIIPQKSVMVFADFVASLFKKRTATHINQTSINYSSRCSEAGCDFLVSI